MLYFGCKNTVKKDVNLTFSEKVGFTFFKFLKNAKSLILSCLRLEIVQIYQNKLVILCVLINLAFL